MNKHTIVIAALAFSFWCVSSIVAIAAPSLTGLKPNINLVMTDDQGMGDLSEAFSVDKDLPRIQAGSHHLHVL